MIPLTISHYETLAAIADREAGLHMAASKRTFVASRLQRRLRCLEFDDFGTYLRLVTDTGPEGATERQHFVSALTTNVTDVYREPHHFGLLADHLADWARQTGRHGARFLIWSAGCASGDEPLSIAATCRAVLGTAWTASVRILATDVDRDVLKIAADRSDDPVLASRLATLPSDVRSKRAPWPDDGKSIIAEFQSCVTYLRHNLLERLPLPGQFDMIFCRNVTIYFRPDAQAVVHRRLRARLAPGGIVAIGHSERMSAEIEGLKTIGRTAFRLNPVEVSMSSGASGWR